jgi:serine/threonine protein kinase/TolA-binding protein
MNEPDRPRKRTLPLEVARRLDPICDGFEDDWLAGRRPQLESFLDLVPQADRTALLGELLALELDYRRRRGEHAEVEDYRQRFPGCDKIIEAAFATLTPSASELTPTLLTSPPHVEATVPDEMAIESESLPQQAGRYRIEGEIGRGGMGVVLRARDPDLNRPLAVKMLLKYHANEAHLERRFREEAQITGQLQHPGIPPIHEIGVLPDGRPFFAMKLIKGQTLAELLRQRRQPSEDLPRLLSIFGQVCQTLAYAHSKGVIHRDLKPSNIMVGAFAEVQVMDWGLAKLLTGDHTETMAGSAEQESTIDTIRSAMPEWASRPGTLLGTPAYMAPEQARGEVDQLDERCDVFGLGAILCEMLTGQPPCAAGCDNALFARAMGADMSDTQARLGSCGADAELVQLARACLSLRRPDRPRGAGVVAQALADYQAGVQERLRQAEVERGQVEIKLREERKRRRWMIALGVVLLTGTVLSTWLAMRAAAARDEKELALERAETAANAERQANELAQARLEQYKKTTDVLASIFQNLNPRSEEKEGPSLREQLSGHLKEAAAQLDGLAIDDPLTAAGLQNTLGVSLITLGDAAQAIELLDKARRIRETHLGPDHSDTLTSVNDLASAYLAAYKPDKAVPLLEQARAKLEIKHGPDHPDTLTSMNNLATAYWDTMQREKAMPLYEQILTKRKAVLGPNHRDTLTSLNNLATAYMEVGQAEKAIPLLEETIARMKDQLAPDHPNLLTVMNNLAWVYKEVRQFDRALPLYEQALAKRKSKLGLKHADTLISMNNLAMAYQAAGQPEKAVPLLEQTLAQTTEIRGPESPDTLTCMGNLAWTYQSAGKLDRAEPLWGKLVQLRRKVDGPESPVTAGDLTQLGLNLIKQKKFAKAEPVLRECLAIRAKIQPEDWLTFNTRSLLGDALLGQKKYAEAEPLLLQGYEGMKQREAKIPPQGKSRLTDALERLVRLYEAMNQKDKAKQWRERGEEIKASKKDAAK